MSKIKVHNWDRWQTYRKDRGMPPWIKLHRCLLRNVDWVTLSDAERGQLVSMWMLAADDDGKLPADPDVIKRLCQLEKEPDLKMFKDKGFLDFGANVTPTRRQDDAIVTPEWRQRDALDAESSDAEMQKQKKITPTPRKRGVPSVDVAVIVEHLNKTTGKRFAADRATGEIERCLKAGATQAECIEVIDHLWRKWGGNPKMVDHLNKVTPFRKSHFESYLDEARAGEINAVAMHQPGPIPMEVIANLEFEMADGADLEAWLSAQPQAWIPALREKASRMAGAGR